MVSMDGVMQAPGGLTSSRASSTGVLIGHYERDGEIQIVDGALDSPSKRGIARQERMQREEYDTTGGSPEVAGERSNAARSTAVPSKPSIHTEASK